MPGMERAATEEDVLDRLAEKLIRAAGHGTTALEKGGGNQAAAISKPEPTNRNGGTSDV